MEGGRLGTKAHRHHNTVGVMTGNGLGGFGPATMFSSGGGDLRSLTFGEVNPLTPDLSDSLAFTEGTSLAIMPAMAMRAPTSRSSSPASRR